MLLGLADSQSIFEIPLIETTQNIKGKVSRDGLNIQKNTVQSLSL